LLRHLHCLKKKLLFYIYAVIVKQKKTEWCRIYYSLTQCRRVRAAIQTQNEWSGGPEAGTLGAGSVGVGGYGWLCWLVAGLRRVPSAWLRCAWTLWAVAGRPPGSDLFASKMGGGGRAVADAGGARVEGSTIDTAWRRGTASHWSLFLTRRQRCVRQQDDSRGFWAKCSEQDVAPVTPIHHLRTANARVYTSRMPCALTVILLPESRAHGCHMLQTWFGEWTLLGVRVAQGREPRRRRRG
jgi:hypothetical protein